MAINWKINVSITTILLIVAVASLLLLSPLNCGSKPGHLVWTDIHTELVELGYKPATHSTDPKPDDLPPAVKQGSTSTVSGQGYWTPEIVCEPGDSVEVELSVVELGNGTAFVKVTIDSVEVKWHRLEHYHRDTSSRFTLFGEVSNCASRVGMGIGYRIFTVAEVDVSPALSISLRLDWVAGEVQLSRDLFGSVSVGVGCGYRVFTDDGLHVSGLISIGL